MIDLKKHWKKYRKTLWFGLIILGIIILMLLLANLRIVFSIWFLIPVFIYFTLVFSLERIFSKSTKKSEKSIRVFLKTGRDLIFLVLSFVFVVFLIKISHQIFNDTYYIRVSDLPKELIEKGYTKENIIRLFSNKINDINDDSNEKITKNNTLPTDPYGKIKIEAFGNSVYFDEIIFLLRGLFGYQRAVLLQINSDSENIYSNIYISNKNRDGKYGINKRTTTLKNRTFVESFNEMLYQSTTDFFLIANPVKLVYHFANSNNLEQLDYIFKLSQSGYFNWVDRLSPEERFLCYSIYGGALSYNNIMFRSIEQYEAAKNVLDKNFAKIDYEKIDKFYDDWLLSLVNFGYADKVLNLIEKEDILNKVNDAGIIYSMKAYAYFNLLNYEKAIEFFELSLVKTKSKELKSFGLRKLAEIELTKGNLEKAEELSYNSLLHKYDYKSDIIYQFCLNKLGKFSELSNLLDKRADGYRERGVGFFGLLTLSPGIENNNPIDQTRIFYDIYPKSRNSILKKISKIKLNCNLLTDKFYIESYIKEYPNDIQVSSEFYGALAYCNLYNVKSKIDSLAFKHSNLNFENEYMINIFYGMINISVPDFGSNSVNKKNYQKYDLIKKEFLNEKIINSFKRPFFKNILLLLTELVDSDFSYELDNSKLGNFEKMALQRIKSSIQSFKINNKINNTNSFDFQIVDELIFSILNNPANTDSWHAWGLYLEKLGDHENANNKFKIEKLVEKELNNYPNSFPNIN